MPDTDQSNGVKRISLAWFTEGFGHVVSDVRAKLIDEGWFGRRVTERSGRSDLGWFRDDERNDQARDPSLSHDPNRDQSQEQGRGHDLDR